MQIYRCLQDVPHDNNEMMTHDDCDRRSVRNQARAQKYTLIRGMVVVNMVSRFFPLSSSKQIHTSFTDFVNIC